MNNAQKITYVAIDYETHPISYEHPIPKPVCLSYAYRDEINKYHKGLIVGLEKIEKFVKALLERKDVYIIAHNASFELNVTAHWFPELRKLINQKLDYNKVICTKIYESLISNISKDNQEKLGLSALVQKYYNVDISESKTDPDAWRLRYNELENIPQSEWPEAAINYAIDDSVWTERIFLEHHNKEHPNIDYSLTVSAEYFLNKMGLDGIRVEHERVLLLERELTSKLAPKYDNLLKLKLVSKNAKTGKWKKESKTFKELLLERLPEDLRRYTAKENISTDSESLTYYLSVTPDDELKSILLDYIEIMKYEKILSAFVERLKEGDIIRTQYTGAVSSGRTSSHSSKLFPSVNIQQMPREVKDVTYDIRGCFVPRDGFYICSIDYNGLELSSTAHRLYQITKHSYMRSKINSGSEPTDMHSILGARIKSLKERRNVSYTEFVEHKKEPGYKEYRQIAKPINLGFPGGIGYDTMRTLLARDGVHPKFKVLEKNKYEDRLKEKAQILRGKGFPVRIKQTKIDEFQLVYDELVELKNELFNVYPDLKMFLQDTHLKYMTGQIKAMKNEFGKWEKEPMYRYEIGGFERDWATYTAFCNGTLMQSPSAIGAKKAMVDIIKHYEDKHDVMRPLAFIHDEIVFEVTTDEGKMVEIIEDVSKRMIDNMQKILYSVRIAVEAEVFPYWKKAGGFYTKQYWKNVKDKTLYSK